MDKSKLVEKLISQIRGQYDRAIAAVRDAAEGATGDDTKAESKYDTRGLESSYLAAGQVEQAERLARELQLVENFDFRKFDSKSEIDIGALVKAKLDGKEIIHYLIAPAGGGIAVEASGIKVTVIGGTSPLTGHLLEKRVGDKIEQPALEILEVS